MAIRILLADDHHVVRHGLKKILEAEADFTVVGEGESGKQILDLLESGIKADVLLTDLSMPGMDGIQLAQSVTASYPGLQIVLLTFQEEEGYIQRAFQAGINSYLFKTSEPQELLYAVRQVVQGKAYLCSGLSNLLIHRISGWAQQTNIATDNIDFSERELEVLKLIAEGYTNEEAADKLFTSRRTVEGHRQAMIDKTGSRNSLALIRYAVLHGLVT